MANQSGNPTRPLRSSLIYLFVVMLGGALLAPWFYWLAQTIAPGSEFVHKPFHRFVNRALLAVALAGLWPLLRSLGLTKLQDVGIVNPVPQWKLLLGGFALGFGSLACVAFLTLALHERQINSALTSTQIAGDLAKAAGTAVVVAVMEEILFRGAVFGGLRKFWDWRVALLVSSMSYAIVHFLKTADVHGPITWSSGLKLLPLMLRGFANWQEVIPGFFNLTIVGILLGLAYQRTGNLYCSIGLHAGWIFWLRVYGMLIVPMPDNVNHGFWGTQKLTDSWLTLCVLALPLVALAISTTRKPRMSPA